jgi:formate dehydrogenase major subunit
MLGWTRCEAAGESTAKCDSEACWNTSQKIASIPPNSVPHFFLKTDRRLTCERSKVSSVIKLLSKWPLVRQIRERKDGTGVEAMSDQTLAMRARIDDAKIARSICPYCGVGCGQLIYHKDGKLISIEGDPESPISQGNLCPKGAASYQLLTHSLRETKVKYRAPRAKNWTEITLDRAMDMVAERVWESRKRTLIGQENGSTINHTTAICHLGGATLDNEENYLIKKLFTGGLGMVCVSNQARI